MLDDELKDETIKNIFDALNVMEGRTEEKDGKVVFTHSFTQKLFKVLRVEHRTLQQNFWRMISELAASFAEDNKEERFFDARNSDSVKFAREVNKIDSYFSHI